MAYSPSIVYFLIHEQISSYKPSQCSLKQLTRYYFGANWKNIS